MKTIAILRRDLLSYFVSPSGYVFGLLFLLVLGLTLTIFLNFVQGNVESFFLLFGLRTSYSYIFWFLFLLVPPLICMRSIADEKRLGTYELMVTSGVREHQIVLGKFLGAYIFYLYLWSLLLLLFLLINQFGELEWGVVATLMFGIGGSGLLFCAAGILASTLSENSLIAALIAIVFNIAVFLLDFLRHTFPPESLSRFYIDYLSPLHHFSHDYSQGVVDFRYLLYYGTVAIVLLFVATKRLERRRWS